MQKMLLLLKDSKKTLTIHGIQMSQKYMQVLLLNIRNQTAASTQWLNWKYPQRAYLAVLYDVL